MSRKLAFSAVYSKIEAIHWSFYDDGTAEVFDDEADLHNGLLKSKTFLWRWNSETKEIEWRYPDDPPSSWRDWSDKSVAAKYLRYVTNKVILDESE